MKEDREENVGRRGQKGIEKIEVGGKEEECSTTERRRPEKDNTRPEKDNRRPEKDGRTPAKCEKGPEKDGRTFENNGRRPEKDSSRSGKEERSGKDGGRPETDGRKSEKGGRGPDKYRRTPENDGRPEEDSSRPEKDGRRPDKDGGASEKDRKRPEEQAESPIIDGRRPERDDRRSGRDGKRIERDGRRPEKDGSRPEKDGIGPEIGRERDIKGRGRKKGRTGGNIWPILTWLFFFLISVTQAAVLVHDNKWEPRPRPYKYWADLQKDPTFHPDNIRHVVVANHNIAFIPCKITGLVDHSVSWIQKATSSVLTVDNFVYTTDKRITSHINEERNEQVLMITDVTFEDDGEYTCQVSTQPAISMTFYLQVINAVALITGKRERYLNSGEDIILHCTVPRLTYPPEYFIWHLGDEIYTYEDKGNVEVLTDSRSKSATLIVHNAQVSDSGNYTCETSNSLPTSVVVHVVKEEAPSAIQHEDSSSGYSIVPKHSHIFSYLTLLLLYEEFFHLARD